MIFRNFREDLRATDATAMTRTRLGHGSSRKAHHDRVSRDHRAHLDLTFLIASTVKQRIKSGSELLRDETRAG